jgi:hypothetical protein
VGDRCNGRSAQQCIDQLEQRVRAAGVQAGTERTEPRTGEGPSVRSHSLTATTVAGNLTSSNALAGLNDKLGHRGRTASEPWPEPGDQAKPVPSKVVRQPDPQAKAARAGGAVAPSGRDLGQPTS